MSNYKLANPAPLGLLAFGLTTVLLNLHNAGLFSLNSMILAMGIAFGGLAQIIVGAMEYRRGNTFGTVAFSSYGFFWWSLVLLILMPNMPFFGTVAPTDNIAMAAYFLMWGIFTFAMFFGTLKTNRALQFVFLSLAILFFLLTTKELLGNPAWFSTIVGIEGIICGLSAVYLGIAEVINETNNETILPICPVKNS
ncbi:MAG: acetate uptake transporter [Candidatus Bathyarchaeota archaeon]|nr:acetate uptake transporter [Candidatus Termiticorpusculum sp.]